jgi:hypothetical protein
VTAPARDLLKEKLQIFYRRHEIDLAVLDKEEIGALQILGLEALLRDRVLPEDYAKEAKIGEGSADEIVGHWSHDSTANAAAQQILLNQLLIIRLGGRCGP